ncbi:hypothetical protein, partial [Mycobacterium szulgai]|uniref:hypothetical protein n=1 Tax=Mycobacterium szulgai TaxID=1787 RepID=UPI0021F26277
MASLAFRIRVGSRVSLTRWAFWGFCGFGALRPARDGRSDCAGRAPGVAAAHLGAPGGVPVTGPNCSPVAGDR